ncbi:hypothetical protein DPMN_087157 [Dreissena polymorpha]|uniref:Uncharacterized protein n=1 Tax=Dreissena polymorpha TaxID=45954 RepID=A0A9D4QV82_DREPO|nr:hypothetical protein DPMN_087157 [Dreissena polymorpha]
MVTGAERTNKTLSSRLYEERLEWSLGHDARTRNSAVGRMKNVLNGHWNRTLEQKNAAMGRMKNVFNGHWNRTLKQETQQ